MIETNIVANRINWIDWAKAFAITFVVFGHIPEERGSILINYIVTFHMSLFFFILGTPNKGWLEYAKPIIGTLFIQQ
jgi:fucose 4-O-acetylase-like acetyltransferase